jgi:hypothetical protein
MIMAWICAGRQWYVRKSSRPLLADYGNDNLQILAKEFNRSILARDSGKDDFPRFKIFKRLFVGHITI